MIQSAVAKFSVPQAEKRLAGQLRFSGDETQTEKPSLTPELAAAAEVFRKALDVAERLPGSDKIDSPFNQLLAHVLNGSGSFGNKVIASIQELTRGPNLSKSCKIESYTDDKNRPHMGYRVQAGTMDILLKRRTLHAASTTTFDDLLESKFGYNERVVLSVTGWTKPPVDPFLNSDYHRKRMEKMPKEQWPKYVEKVYVNTIKDFLGKVVAALQEELGDQFDAKRDLGIIYGVTDEGVDRAVEEYCLENSLPILGVTCYDWAPYIPDKAGLPEVFIADSPAEFGSIMANTANRILITGGRGFAASVQMNGQKAEGAERRVPVDLLHSFESIFVPPVVSDKDNITSKIVNGASLAKALGCNPWESPLVQQAINGRTIDNRDVFTTTYIVKDELERLYRSRRLATAMTTGTTP